MTKHELLNEFESNEYLTCSRVMDLFLIFRPQSWLALEKLRKEGCIKIILKAGRVKAYQMTERGLKKSHFFDDGCPNLECSCKK